MEFPKQLNDMKPQERWDWYEHQKQILRDAAKNGDKVELTAELSECFMFMSDLAELGHCQMIVMHNNAVVVGNREQLVMAIHNLIENAINYSSENTRVNIAVDKKFDSTMEQEIAEIAIKDQGIGIADSEIDRIFERFYRIDPARSRNTGGTGLGLSIVKHVVQNHNGEIKVWSTPGIGSTFTLRIPILNKGKI